MQICPISYTSKPICLALGIEYLHATSWTVRSFVKISTVKAELNLGMVMSFYPHFQYLLFYLAEIRYKASEWTASQLSFVKIYAAKAVLLLRA